jgi:Fe/S biogenesis protein NfuA
VKETDIFVHMGGGCQGCGMAAMTLRQGVETMIRQKVPRVRNIHDSTDHAAGENPFYE